MSFRRPHHSVPAERKVSEMIPNVNGFTPALMTAHPSPHHFSRKHRRANKLAMKVRTISWRIDD